jgi:hypothetical protein
VQPSGERCIPATAVTFCDGDTIGTYSGVGLHSPFPTWSSSIFTGASSLQHKENEDLRDSPDWLHRNDNYIRRSHQMYGNNAFQQSTEILREPGASAFGEI